MVSGKLPTFPSPNPTLGPKWEVTVNADLGEGYVGSFLDETYIFLGSTFIWYYSFFSMLQYEIRK